VLIPPLVLIFLVLGTIFLGVATPTEGGAMGALGAFDHGAGAGASSTGAAHQALDNTTKLSCFVLFILIGSTVFSLHLQRRRRPHLGRAPVRQAARRRARLPDRGEHAGVRARHVHRLLRDRLHRDPAAGAGGREDPAGMLPPGTDALVWFGVIIAMNLQTSFLTPPFGFALFYLRSVAAKSDYNDRITGERIPAVTTAQIYKGAIAFIVLQVIMVAASSPFRAW
jgi:TRAP-type mannitol/chloroaromatic compound transport system permease large subunit